MTFGLAIMAALVSALTQAVAHALLKSGDDKLVIRGLIGLTGAVATAPLCAVVPLPTTALWPWLIASSAVHAVYQLVLIRAYDQQDFSIAYPMARGIVPLATTVLGVLFLGDRLAMVGIAGVVAVTTGLIALACSRGANFAGLRAAMAAGLLTTAYTLIDAKAVRLAEEEWTFIAWFFLLDGVTMMMIVCFRRGSATWVLFRAEGGKGIAAGVASLITYSTALLALRYLPTGGVSALRETSVVFGAIIAATMLKEVLGLQRLLGTALVAGGGGLIILGLIRA